MHACLIVDFGYHLIASCCLFIAAFVITQCPNYSTQVRSELKPGLTLEVAGDIILDLVVA